MAIRQLAAAGAAAAMICAQSAQAACERHIYNNSDAPWTFYAQTEEGLIPVPVPGGPLLAIPTGSKGNVWFSGAMDMVDTSKPCSVPKNGPCVIAPRTTVTITYTTTAGESIGRMAIFDRNRDYRVFSFTGAASNCPYVHHSGGTGAVAVNDPADGDFNIWGVALWADD